MPGFGFGFGFGRLRRPPHLARPAEEFCSIVWGDTCIVWGDTVIDW